MSLHAITDTNGTATIADLRRAARAGDAAAARETARQFEALFVNLMIKQMREAMPAQGGLFDGEGMKLYQGMYDQQLSLAMAQRGGIGLADAIERQLLPNGAPAGGEGQPLYFPTHRLPARPAPLIPIDPQSPSAGPSPAAGPKRRERPGAAVPSAGSVEPSGPEAFVKRLLPHARRAAAMLGVAPEVLIAQAALETGWGRHMIRDGAGHTSHNLFGIKASGGWSGDSISVPTLEYRDGLPRRETAAFRGYPDEAASFADYVRLVGGNPRYQRAIANAASPEAYLRGLQEAGYATDPAYADKILSILRRGLPGLSGESPSGAPLKVPAARPTSTQSGDPEVARLRPHPASEEST